MISTNVSRCVGREEPSDRECDRHRRGKPHAQVASSGPYAWRRRHELMLTHNRIARGGPRPDRGALVTGRRASPGCCCTPGIELQSECRKTVV